MGVNSRCKWSTADVRMLSPRNISFSRNLVLKFRAKLVISTSYWSVRVRMYHSCWRGKIHTKFQWENLKGKENVGQSCVDGIIKMDLKRHLVNMIIKLRVTHNGRSTLNNGVMSYFSRRILSNGVTYRFNKIKLKYKSDTLINRFII
jgi:hypothetical protein